jgi:hypothetical protein
MSWTHVQGTPGIGVQATSGSQTSLSATFGSSVTAGNLIVVGYVSNVAPSGFSVKDNKNNINYATAIQDSTGGSTTITILYYIAAVGGSSFQVTTSSSNGGGYPDLTIDEYSCSGSISTDGTAVGHNSSTQNLSTSSAIVPTGNDLVYAVAGLNGSWTTVTQGNGANLRYHATQVGGTAFGVAAEDYLNVTSSVTPSISVDVNTNMQLVAVAFKESSAGASILLGL